MLQQFEKDTSQDLVYSDEEVSNEEELSEGEISEPELPYHLQIEQKVTYLPLKIQSFPMKKSWKKKLKLRSLSRTSL